jgi:carbonic anhydrase
VRQSPIIGPKIPVHGLMVDLETGRVEWLVNGYQALEIMGAQPPLAGLAAQPMDAFKAIGNFDVGEMKFPEAKIGEASPMTNDWLAGKVQPLAATPPPSPPPPAPAPPPKIPIPPPLRPRLRFHKGLK